MGKQKIFHVQIKFPHTGWRLASQHYSKRAAEREKKKWTSAAWFLKEGHKARVLEVKKRTMGLVRIGRSGKVLGYSSPYDRLKPKRKRKR